MYRYQPHRRQSSAGVMAGAGRILSRKHHSRKGGVYAGAIRAMSRKHQSRKGGYGVSGARNPWLEHLADFRAQNAKLPEGLQLRGVEIMKEASTGYSGMLKGPYVRKTQGAIKPKPKGFYWATEGPDGPIPIHHIQAGAKPKVFRVELPAGERRRVTKLGQVEIGPRRPRGASRAPSRRGSRAVAFDEFQIPQEVNEDELQFSRG